VTAVRSEWRRDFRFSMASAPGMAGCEPLVTKPFLEVRPAPSENLRAVWPFVCFVTRICSLAVLKEDPDDLFDSSVGDKTGASALCKVEFPYTSPLFDLSTGPGLPEPLRTEASFSGVAPFVTAFCLNTGGVEV